MPAARAVVIAELDVRAFLALHHALADWLGVMAVLSVIGGGWGGLFVVPLFASVRTRRFARSLSLVLVTTAVLVFTTKRLVARVRPCFCLQDVHARVFAAPTDYSFPSGHSAGSFAFTMFVAIVMVSAAKASSGRERLLRLGGAVALVLLALGVGLSRIALGVHFPGDVLAGALLGTTVAAVGAWIHTNPRLCLRSTRDPGQTTRRR